jgi:hypothetical protein
MDKQSLDAAGSDGLPLPTDSIIFDGIQRRYANFYTHRTHQPSLDLCACPDRSKKADIAARPFRSHGL